jgi:proteasome lid subunit RPN8/RPN11
MIRRKVRGIARDTLHFILEASRSSMPEEFAGLLQSENDIITEVLMLPGTESSRMSALIRLYMLPNMQVAGSAHSHPSGSLRPSEEDILFFSRTGDYHIIAGPPFDEKSWACYDASGERRELPVLDVEFKDEDFEGGLGDSDREEDL